MRWSRGGVASQETSGSLVRDRREEKRGEVKEEEGGGREKEEL